MTNSAGKFTFIEVSIKGVPVDNSSPDLYTINNRGMVISVGISTEVWTSVKLVFPLLCLNIE